MGRILCDIADVLCSLQYQYYP